MITLTNWWPGFLFSFSWYLPWDSVKPIFYHIQLSLKGDFLVNCVIAYSNIKNKNIFSNSINGWTLGKSFAELLVFVLRQMFGILYFRTTLSIYIILLTFPIIQGATIYYLFKQRAQTDYSIINENETTVFGTKEKFRFFPKILKYLAPLVLVYFSQHFAMICLVS